ncbi:non-ribosomal peptide synthetase [Clavibacter michiganensis]|uniref:Non-ribosomal peptide synthetase n=1 Tax=Clavibacter michiganensis subsp. insidiosus TaxID=33014 RepID=A0A0D5CM66_9MICO|nr:non-ribosomal peptide synthetase [Clavibacter michiganensis]AJW80731.1 hypothetical protein VO01_15970 [Clavibacter michiganensis subsp. insidiosus]AWF99929.1 non-ribosomal peptide synthetase [Clavibacter michiganensis subsp. insidiosus]RIJ45103.1 non-ribosomal peptide synthetase [Clavibacter michiganensis subsp. insidiosus]
MVTHQPFTSIVDVLFQHDSEKHEEDALIYLIDGETREDRLTFGQLAAKVRKVAGKLRARGAEGERVLILLPSGPDFIVAFLGCLAAGAIAVPLYPPKKSDKTGRIESVVSDCAPRFALISPSYSDSIGTRLAEIRSSRALEVLDVTADDVDSAFQARQSNPDDVAFLQYTSGSTGSPKGVMVTHGGIVANQKMMAEAFASDKNTVVLSWLPLYHDMGLIGGVLHPLWLGRPLVLMRPNHFLQKPARWLQAISRYRATISGAPNSAYETCSESVSPADVEGLDLSCWKIAFDGAEPVRPATISRFTERFAEAGLSADALLPCYGLAEATLLVSGTRTEPKHAARTPPRLRTDSAASSGGLPRGSVVRIVDPATALPLGEGEEGEIWVAGPHIAAGYWSDPASTARTFRASIADDAREFLRTGDLGVIWAEQLFVTGRLKDVVIIGGVNHHPQDIEKSVEETSDALRVAGGAAFSVDSAGPGDAESVVIVHELRRDAAEHDDVTALPRRIRDAVTRVHGVDVHAVVLVDTGAVPRTSSGKVRRSAAREMFLSQAFTPRASWRRATDPSRFEGMTARDGDDQLSTWDAWLHAEISHVIGPDAGPISDDESLITQGIDSIAALMIRNSIEDRTGIELPLDFILRGPSIRDISERITHAEDGGRPRNVTQGERPVGATDEFPLSAGQKSLWFLHQLEPTSSAYNMVLGARLARPLDIPAFENAMRAVIRRHGALRTNYMGRDGTPFQREHAEATFELDVVDLGSADRGDVVERMRARAREPFDLEHGRLVRVSLFRADDGEQHLLLGAHHLVGDMWSFSILLREIGETYTAAQEAKPIAVQDTPAPYSSFVARQSNALSGPKGKAEIAWWVEHLRGMPPVLELPTDFERPSRQRFVGSSVHFEITERLSSAIRARAKQLGCTANAVLLSGYRLLLHIVSAQDRFVIGMPASGRTHTEHEVTVGYFVNVVPVRSEFDPAIAIDAFIRCTAEEIIDSLSHQDVPLSVVVDEMQLQRDSSRSPLFQVTYTLERTPETPELAELALGRPGARVTIGALELEAVELPQQEGQFDVDLSVVDADGPFSGAFNFNSEIFSASTIRRWSDLYLELLDGIVGAHEATALDVYLDAMSRRAGDACPWNASIERAPSAEGPLLLVPAAISAQCRERPDAEALVAGAVRMTYGELGQRASDLAFTLSRNGVGPDVPVILLTDKSAEAIVGVVGILQAGGAYVPVDVNQPDARKRQIIRDSQAQVIVVPTRLVHAAEAVAGTDTVVLSVSIDGTSPRHPFDPPHLAEGHLAYITYTSGSTGVPKGVAVSHGNLSNMLRAWQQAYPLDASLVHLQMASISFDVFTGDLVKALCHGGRLVLCTREDVMDPARLQALVVSEGVNFADFVPSVMRAYAEHAHETDASLPDFKVVVVGSDTWYGAEYAKYRELFGPGTRLVNAYGVTEATIDSTFFESRGHITEEASVPIGTPFAGVRAYVLDQWLAPVVPGTSGELYIGGAGVALGYHGNAGLTAEMFLPDPFGEPGSRMYRTGDRAKLRTDGNIEFLGRMDFQIKLNGHRLEPGEVESKILELPSVRETVAVVLEGDHGQKTLVAYLSAVEGQTVDPRDVRRHLAGDLPDYMVPRHIEVLERLPLSANGKIDRSALPAPAIEASPVGSSPMGPAEEILAEAFCAVLNMTRVGRDDGFFELGGDSIMCMQVVAQARRRGLALTVGDVYQYQTIRRLALGTQLATGSRQEKGSTERTLAVDRSTPAAVAASVDETGWVAAQDVLVPLRVDGSATPLFFVHPAGGGIHDYLAIASDPHVSRTFYAFQDPELTGGRPISDVRELAALYLSEARKIQPGGALNLGGWSLGGRIAAEMARQEEAGGQEVRSLILLDSDRYSLPDEAESTADEGSALLAIIRGITRASGIQISMSESRFLSLPGTEQLSVVVEMAIASNMLGPSAGPEVARLRTRILQRHLLMAPTVDVPELRTTVTLLKAMDAPPHPAGLDLGWRSAATGPFTVVGVPGTHQTMVRPPHSTTVAIEIEHAIQAVERAQNGVRAHVA